MRGSVSLFRYQSQTRGQSRPPMWRPHCTTDPRFPAEGEIAMSRTFILFFVIFSLCLSVSAQVAPEAQTLVPGQPVERQIAGGETHTYRITLHAGQFMRVVLEQKAIGVTLVLAAPDGKQVLEVNLTPAGALESLSAEARASGDYRLTVRAGGSAAIVGSYQVRLEVKAAATVQDRQRIAAERWMLEASELQSQGGKTAEQTIDKLQQALSVWRELGDRYWSAWSLSSIGVAYYRLSRYEKAIEYNEQALAIHRKVKSRTGEGHALNNLGIAYDKLGRYEKAIGYSEQALEIRREVKDRAGEADTLYSLARAERSQGNLLAARTHIEESLKIAESLRSDLLSPESRASFLANVQSSYRLYTDLLMRQHRAEPTGGFDALAVETSERQRARSLLDLLTEARADVRQGVDANLIERERTLAKQLNDKAQQLAQATKPEQAATLKQEVSQLETDLERAQVAIRNANP